VLLYTARISGPFSSQGMFKGATEMKRRMQHDQPHEREQPGNEQVLMEVQSFLQALASYPERFAKEPTISFEQHLSNLVASSQSELRRRN
jgi:hypothetical protein